MINKLTLTDIRKALAMIRKNSPPVRKDRLEYDWGYIELENGITSKIGFHKHTFELIKGFLAIGDIPYKADGTTMEITEFEGMPIVKSNLKVEE